MFLFLGVCLNVRLKETYSKKLLFCYNKKVNLLLLLFLTYMPNNNNNNKMPKINFQVKEI